MGVPAFVVDVDEPHAALDHPPRQQAGPRERRLVRVGAVHLQRVLALAVQVHQLGGRRLQAEGHLVGGDARGDLRIAVPGQAPVIERADQVERVALKLASTPGGLETLRIGIALVAQADAGIDRRQEPARPVGRAAADAAAGRHHDEGGQVAGLRAETVDDPRTKARPARLRKTRVEEDLRRRVIELVGVHRLDDADVVDDLRQVRQHLGQFRAALAVAGEFEARTKHGRVGADEGIALPADDFRRDRLALDRANCGL